MDCVTANGDVVIAYWSHLSWRKLSFTWHSVDRFPRNGDSYHRSSLATCSAPERGNESIRWNAHALGLTVDAPSIHEALTQSLLESDDGIVSWTCENPGAAATFSFDDGRPLEGTGYVERIQMTIPPWRLHMRELWWGRWVSDDAQASAVWIDWRGAAARSWLFVNNVPATLNFVDHDSMRSGESMLNFRDSRVLQSRKLGAVLSAIPGLSAIVPDRLLGWTETKWCSRAEWHEKGSAVQSGWAIHELVVMP